MDSGPTGTALDTGIVALALTVATLELAVTGAECVWVSTMVLAMVVPFWTDDTVEVQRVVYVVKLLSVFETGPDVVALTLEEKPLDTGLEVTPVALWLTTADDVPFVNTTLVDTGVVDAPVLIGPTVAEEPLPVGPTTADVVPL